MDSIKDIYTITEKVNAMTVALDALLQRREAGQTGDIENAIADVTLRLSHAGRLLGEKAHEIVQAIGR
ncbi:MAG: hypothetical protein IPM61_16705 [Chlorobi bacterium]|nr:hypothetical protein [Chlorobiota bacterium]